MRRPPDLEADPALRATEQWKAVLRAGGYEAPEIDRRHLRRVLRYSRTWRRLHRLLGIEPSWTFFEFGCGGGAQLVPLAAHGHRVVGVDVSPEVLGRCREYADRVERALGRRLDVKMREGDFFAMAREETFDVVFNFGVIEHFLDDAQRRTAWQKMRDFARPGGWVVSVVPSGMHPMRAAMRVHGLGGYQIPEVDYSDRTALEEVRAAGLEQGRVYPANLFAHLLLRQDRSAAGRLASRAAYLAAQLVPPVPSRFAFRNAGALIIIGRKPPSPRA